MDIHTNILLKNYTTMKLGGPARFIADVKTPDDVKILCENAESQSLPFFVLGGGSNTIVKDEGFNGIVLRMRIPGIEVTADDLYSTTLRVGAGESWDGLVSYSVERGLTGIETMSAIPGTVGAAPVQNIGAYGQEVSETLVSVEAFDTDSKTFVTLTNKDCQFDYRDSIFRGEAKGQYIITAVTFKLTKGMPTPPFYSGLQTYLESHGVIQYTPTAIRNAIIAIRAEKLPDPSVSPSAGSFFKNAIIEQWLFDELQQTYPDIPNYPMADGKYKIPTGWLIEQTGLKGKTLYGFKIHDKNALVLINEAGGSYADLASARDEIIVAVLDKFRITIEQEPLELP